MRIARVIALGSICAATVLAACGDDPVSPGIALSRITIDPLATTQPLYLRDTVRLQARRVDAGGAPLPGDTARFTWESSDTTVVMVTIDGHATVVGLGTASVTARIADLTNPAWPLPSITDTASASVEFRGSPVVWHAGPVVAAGTAGAHQCVLLPGGRAHCRGRNWRGQTGVGLFDESIQSWTPVAGDIVFSTVSVGRDHSCGLAHGGVAYCWGSNEVGEQGVGRTHEPTRVPTPFVPDSLWRSVEAMERHTCGYTTAGNAPICAGNNAFGQRGRVPDLAADAVLAPWGSGEPASMAEVEYWLGCTLRPGGEAYCAGAGGSASGVTGEVRGIPTLVESSVPFTSIAVGFYHACGLSAAGLAYCWGINEKGELGTGDLAWSAAARPVTGGLVFTRIFAFDRVSCGLTAAGELWCWGSNEGQALGRTRLAHSAVPIRIRIGNGVTWVDKHGLFYQGACAIDATDQLVCWGSYSRSL